MFTWFYEKSELRRTPSLVDGIPYEKEQRYRREGARFIIRVGSTMKLRYDTMATGVVYFHRFYMYHSFKTFPRFVTASCCLFLAGKVEETPKKCKDIIKTARQFLSDQQFATFGDDPKEEVLTLERIVLQTIKFDLQIDHPYGYLLKYAKSLKGDQEKLQKMVQMAWTFINDSLCTTICLQWEPEIVAIALMFLAGKLSKFEVIDWQGRISKHKNWWDMFVEDINIELLEDICHQVLDLYSTPLPDTPQDSPPNSPSPQVTPSQLTPAPVPSSSGAIPPPPPVPIPPPGMGPPQRMIPPGVMQPPGPHANYQYPHGIPPPPPVPPPPPPVPPQPPVHSLQPPLPPPPVPPNSWDNFQNMYQNYKGGNFPNYSGSSSVPPPIGTSRISNLPPPHPPAMMNSIHSIPHMNSNVPPRMPLPPNNNPSSLGHRHRNLIK